MMKKYLLTFLFSMGLLTATSLVAMEEEPENDEPRKRKTLPTKIQINLPDESVAAGLGDLPPEGITILFENLSIHDLNVIARTSKAMYCISEISSIWRKIAQDLPINIDPTLNVKDQVKNYFCLLFSDLSQDYTVSKKLLSHLIKPCKGKKLNDFLLITNCKIGNRIFQVENVEGVHQNILYSLVVQSFFHHLDDKDQIIFHGASDEGVFKCAFSLGYILFYGYTIRLWESAPDKEGEVGLFVQDGSIYAKLFGKEPMKIEKTDDCSRPGVLSKNYGELFETLQNSSDSDKRFPKTLLYSDRLVGGVTELLHFTASRGYTSFHRTWIKEDTRIPHLIPYVEQNLIARDMEIFEKECIGENGKMFFALKYRFRVWKKG